MKGQSDHRTHFRGACSLLKPGKKKAGLIEGITDGQVDATIWVVLVGGPAGGTKKLTQGGGGTPPSSQHRTTRRNISLVYDPQRGSRRTSGSSSCYHSPQEPSRIGKCAYLAGQIYSDSGMPESVAWLVTRTWFVWDTVRGKTRRCSSNYSREWKGVTGRVR